MAAVGAGTAEVSQSGTAARFLLWLAKTAALLAENNLQSLAMGIGLLLLLTLPGFKLMADEARS